MVAFSLACQRCRLGEGAAGRTEAGIWAVQKRSMPDIVNIKSERILVVEC